MRTPVRFLRCARCGKKANPGKLLIYSRFTRSHYCVDIDACDARARRLRKAVE